jgi:release factor glutamine methyltransferase
MRIASNKLGDLIAFYKTELSGLYDENEISILVNFSLKHYLGLDPAQILLKKNENVNQSDVIRIYDACLALKKGIPIQYVLGETEFFGLKLKVNPNVLIPRPETEELVELILNDLKRSAAINISILDIGTGSGCIPIALKKNLPEENVFALDVSKAALEVAQQNAQLNLAPVIFYEADILKEESEDILDSYDLIVSNPPYIAKHEAKSMHSRVKDHEPHLALFVENNEAIIFYRRIIELCKSHLNSGGQLYFELNPIYASAVDELAEKSRIFSKREIIKDLSGHQRFFKAVKHE